MPATETKVRPDGLVEMTFAFDYAGMGLMGPYQPTPPSNAPTTAAVVHTSMEDFLLEWKAKAGVI